MASDSLSNMFKIFHLLLDGIVPGIGTGLPSCSAAIARDSSRALELDGSIIVMDGDGETGPKYEVSQRERAARTAPLLDLAGVLLLIDRDIWLIHSAQRTVLR